MTKADIPYVIGIIVLLLVWYLHRAARQFDAEMEALLTNARRERGYPTQAEHEQRQRDQRSAVAHQSPSYGHPRATPLPRSRQFFGDDVH